MSLSGKNWWGLNHWKLIRLPAQKLLYANLFVYWHQCRRCQQLLHHSIAVINDKNKNLHSLWLQSMVPITDLSKWRVTGWYNLIVRYIPPYQETSTWRITWSYDFNKQVIATNILNGCSTPHKIDLYNVCMSYISFLCLTPRSRICISGT